MVKKNAAPRRRKIRPTAKCPGQRRLKAILGNACRLLMPIYRTRQKKTQKQSFLFYADFSNRCLQKDAPIGVGKRAPKIGRKAPVSRERTHREIEKKGAPEDGMKTHLIKLRRRDPEKGARQMHRNAKPPANSIGAKAGKHYASNPAGQSRYFFFALLREECLFSL